MLIFPAIDLIGGQAVRLTQGDYARMTVYDSDPCSAARRFAEAGATAVHLVDLEGARDGGTPNFEAVCAIRKATGLFCEIGGGIRSMETVRKYLDAGLDRVILGTAAVENSAFLEEAIAAFGDRIAVGVDIRDGLVAVKGWTQQSGLAAMDFCADMEGLGVRTLICTDISRDGAMRGTNLQLYREMAERFRVDITASGGVSTLEDVRRLRAMNLYGAIIGKAYYTGAIDLKEAIEVAR